MAVNIDFLKMCRNNLKSLALIFQVAIYFLASHLQPDACQQCQSSKISIGNKNGQLFLDFL